MKKTKREVWPESVTTAYILLATCQRMQPEGAHRSYAFQLVYSGTLLDSLFWDETSTWPSHHEKEILLDHLDTLKRDCAWPWWTCDIYHINDKLISGIFIFIRLMTQTYWLLFLKKQDLSIYLSICLSIFLSMYPIGQCQKAVTLPPSATVPHLWWGPLWW